MGRLVIAVSTAALLAVGAAAPPVAAQVQGLEIVVPAAPGGGWDQTGRAMQNARQDVAFTRGLGLNLPAGVLGTLLG